jgi:serine/threonine protein kinase
MSDFWDRVGALFEAAVAVPAAEREAFVKSAGVSEDVRKEVLSLLASHEDATDFLEKPATELPVEREQDAPLLAQGTMLGQYRIVRRIDEGGMGVVYEAWDTRLQRASAVKSLKISHADADRERITREALIAARLNHAGIATVYALEEFDTKLYIVSEYVAGETLRNELERGGKLPIDRAVSTALDVTRALCAAHEGGVVHRDLKPENIIRRPDGTVKIVDFGVAQFDEAARERLSITRVTQSGMVVGTPSYMSPEQLLAKGTDSRTDQFAFGVMLYELCTGRHPFGGSSLPTIIARILAAEPDPPTRDDEIPADVWQVIERCLQKDRANRFESTRDLVSALEPIHARLSSHALDPVPPPPVPLPYVHPSMLKWWQFHQVATFIVYVSMVAPAWLVHRSLGRAGLFFFFATLAAVIVAGILRLHLLFSSRVHPADLPALRAVDGPWIRAADILFSALMIVGGIALPSERVGWATLLISVGIGTLVAALFIEPATARNAFRFESRDRDARLAR